MVTAELTTLLTTEDFLAIAEDDGVHRELIRGELQEQDVTTRSFGHSACEAAAAYELTRWNRTQPRPRGRIVSGEARVRLSADPHTIVGMDVACLSPELAAQTDLNSKFIDGAPRLAVVILSPSDQQAHVATTVRLYLESGVEVVWVADPIFPTIAVHRLGRVPELYNADQTLAGDPELPGFSAPVRRLFEDAD